MTYRSPLVPRPDPLERERRISGILFFVTCSSVFLVRWLGGAAGWADPSAVSRAVLFTAALMGILLAHEMGHYAVARLHGFRLSLPWFIPVPVLLGTLGAIIGIREAPRHRTALLEMGAAGPIAGFAAVLAVLGVRGGWADAPVGLPEAGVELGVPLLWPLVGTCFPAFSGTVSTTDPLAFAAWIGCLVTAMNLLPFGQLDGGHVLVSVWPRGARAIGWVVTIALLVAGMAWPGWALWAVFLQLLGTRTPITVRRPEVPLSGRARVLALVCAVIWMLCITPIPIHLTA